MRRAISDAARRGSARSAALTLPSTQPQAAAQTCPLAPEARQLASQLVRKSTAAGALGGGWTACAASQSSPKNSGWWTS
jgi:hypothetical protein